MIINRESGKLESNLVPVVPIISTLLLIISFNWLNLIGSELIFKRVIINLFALFISLIHFISRSVFGQLLLLSISSIKSGWTDDSIFLLALFHKVCWKKALYFHIKHQCQLSWSPALAKWLRTAVAFRGVLKETCSKNMQQNLQKKSNFIEITLRHGCSHSNLLLHNFRTPFDKITSGGCFCTYYTTITTVLYYIVNEKNTKESHTLLKSLFIVAAFPAWKVSVFRVTLVHFFLNLGWIQRDTKKDSVQKDRKI